MLALGWSITTGLLTIVENQDEWRHQFGIQNYKGTVHHIVDREDIIIIILDTKLVPDFVLHACCFFIAGNRPVLMRITHENRASKS